MGGPSKYPAPGKGFATYNCNDVHCGGTLTTIYNKTLKPSPVIECPKCKNKIMELVKWN